jgi:putative oxidoreductase
MADIILLFVRLVFGFVFMLPGIQVHLLGRAGATELARANGVPAPQVAVPLGGVIITIGGAMVAVGAWADVGALLLAVFAVCAAPAMHAFWREEEPMIAQTQMAHFMKNLGLAAGATAIGYVYAAGPVAYSLTGPALVGSWS